MTNADVTSLPLLALTDALEIREVMKCPRLQRHIVKEARSVFPSYLALANPWNFEIPSFRKAHGNLPPDAVWTVLSAQARVSGCRWTSA